MGTSKTSNATTIGKLTPRQLEKLDYLTPNAGAERDEMAKLLANHGLVSDLAWYLKKMRAELKKNKRAKKGFNAKNNESDKKDCRRLAEIQEAREVEEDISNR